MYNESSQPESPETKNDFGLIPPVDTVEKVNQENRIAAAKMIIGGDLKGETDEIIKPLADVLSEVGLKVNSGEIVIEDKSVNEILARISLESFPDEYIGRPLAYLQNQLEGLCRTLSTPEIPKNEVENIQLTVAQYMHDIKVLQDHYKTTEELIVGDVGISSPDKL